MVVLSPQVRGQWADAGRLIRTALAWLLYAAGWTVAKTLRGIATAIGAVFYAAGWVVGRVVWPGLCWCGRAVRIGWDDGRKPLNVKAGRSLGSA